MMSEGAAHEVRPAVADVTVGESRIAMEIRLTGEPMVAGIDLEGLADTNDAPEVEAHDALRALPEEAFAEEFRKAWPRLQGGVIVDVGGVRVPLTLEAVEVWPAPNLELPRDMAIVLTGDLPAGSAPAQVGWVAAYGPIIVRQEGVGDDGYANFLDGGGLSEPLPRTKEQSGLLKGLKRFFGGSD